MANMTFYALPIVEPVSANAMLYAQTRTIRQWATLEARRRQGCGLPSGVTVVMVGIVELRECVVSVVFVFARMCCRCVGNRGGEGVVYVEEVE